MNPQKALKDCEYKLTKIEKKISQIRTHLNQVEKMMGDHYDSMTQDPLLIDHNMYNLSEIKRLGAIQGDYQKFLQTLMQETERLKRRVEMINKKMKSLHIKNERQKEKEALEDLVQLQLIKQNH